jgi:hypothetical protein
MAVHLASTGLLPVGASCTPRTSGVGQKRVRQEHVATPAALGDLGADPDARSGPTIREVDVADEVHTMTSLVGQVSSLIEERREVVVVTSGAIAAGRERLDGVKNRRDVPFRQALAAVGLAAVLRHLERAALGGEGKFRQPALGERDGATRPDTIAAAPKAERECGEDGRSQQE